MTVSPSGETTMHIQSSYYSVRSPGVPAGTRLHCSPGSREVKSFSTPGNDGSRTPRKQLAFPGSPGGRFGSGSPGSFGTPPHSKGNSKSAALPPGRSLLYEQSSRDSSPSVRRRNNLPALPQVPYDDGDVMRYDERTKNAKSRSRDKVSSKAGSEALTRKVLNPKEYKGVLEQDHPEEPTGRGLFCNCICTMIFIMLLITSAVFVLWLVYPDPVLKIGMTPSSALSALKAYLDMNVFGQHIANRLVATSMAGKLIATGAVRDTEPIIMSFHGSTGVGKTHMADILSKHFVDDSSSTHRRHTCSFTFLTDLHLSVSPDSPATSSYELTIRNWVEDQLRRHKSCGYLFLIFDELRVDTPPELAVALSNVLSEIKLRNKAGENGPIIVAIVMSDIGMHDINTHLSGVWDSGTPRENVTSEELVLLIKNAALYMDRYSSSQQQQESTTLQGEREPLSAPGPFSHLLAITDTIVPFLPLERSHLKLCIIHDAISKDVVMLEEAEVTWVADQLSYFPTSTQVFSLSGCKKVSEKVDLLRQKSY